MQDKNFIKEMNCEIDKVIKFKKPCLIALSGYPGSGKTFIARTLSKELGIFLLSNDYVRNYYYQFTEDYSEEKRLEIEDKVSSINNLRLKILLDTRTSFVYDRDFNLKEDFDKFEMVSKILRMKLIKIKVNSSDFHNLEEIKKITMDYNKVYPGIIGDKVEYQSSFDEETYYQIKMRKPHSLPDDFYDFVINNDNNQYFNEQVKTMVKALNDDYLVRRKWKLGEII